MKLGAFSISLSVKNLSKSKSFYESLGFEVFAGSMDMNYLIMKNESKVIGLFQGMFENNILTFNPGWDQSATKLDEFDDVRHIQKSLRDANIETGELIQGAGPGNFMIEDPDGNKILFDQHV